jgi:hypothetical protein
VLVRLLKDHANMRAGTEYVPPWESQARDLIARRLAEEVRPAEPEPAAGETDAETDAETAGDEAEAEGEQSAPKPRAKKKRK